MAALTTVLHYCGHQASKWPQIYQQDKYFATTYKILGIGTTVTDFHIQDGLLCHLFHLCFPTSERANLIWESHYTRMAGHFSMEKTVVFLQKHFYWPKPQQDLSKFIISCTIYAISKPSIKKQGLYTPLPTNEKPWESISMDYMYILSSTKKGNDYVFGVIDRFSKMTILTSYKKNITVGDTTNIFFKRVWVHFWIPQTIISDWDSQFLNTFLSSLWSLLETKLTKSTSFHPQIDDQT
jgi:hypothetical protein